MCAYSIAVARKKCIFQHVGPTVTLNFDLLNPKVNAYIVLTMFRTHRQNHACTGRLTNSRKT